MVAGRSRGNRRPGSAGFRLALLSTVAFASLTTSGSTREPPEPAALTIMERVTKIREAISQRAGEAVPPAAAIGPTTAQWPNWPNWLNGWPNWGNFWRNF